MLLAYYPLQEDEVATAYDATGNGYDGDVIGATLGAEGILGSSAYSFDGVDDNINLNSTPTNVNAPLSISVWFYPETNQGSYDKVYSEGDSSDGASMYIDVDTGDSHTRLVVYDDSATYTVGLHASDTYIGEWKHAVGVITETGGRLYINGELEATDTHSGLNTTPTNARIGGDATGRTRPFDGRIGEFRIYDHALTPAEANYLYEVSTRETIITDTKTHGSAISPNLQSEVALNGQSATAYITGSPDTASEETNEVSLSDGYKETGLTWSNTHTDFNLRVEANLSDVTSRVEVDNIGLLE